MVSTSTPPKPAGDWEHPRERGEPLPGSGPGPGPGWGSGAR